jgi:hypothetical protein
MRLRGQSRKTSLEMRLQREPKRKERKKRKKGQEERKKMGGENL